jgi:hypothetical protein
MDFAVVDRIDRGVLTRWIAAGDAWGLTLAAGFFALNASQCGLPCPADAALTTAICVGTGLITIGPFAAFASSR